MTKTIAAPRVAGRAYKVGIARRIKHEYTKLMAKIWAYQIVGKG